MNRSGTRRLLRLRLLLVAALPLLLSACTMRTLIGVSVDADGSGAFEVSMAFDEELRTLMEQESDEPIDWSSPKAFEESEAPFGAMDDPPEGATVSPYSKDGFEGFTVALDFASLEELDEIPSDSGAGEEEPLPFHITQPEDGRFELTTDGDVFGEVEDEFDMLSESHA